MCKQVKVSATIREIRGLISYRIGVGGRVMTLSPVDEDTLQASSVGDRITLEYHEGNRHLFYINGAEYRQVLVRIA